MNKNKIKPLFLSLIFIIVCFSILISMNNLFRTFAIRVIFLFIVLIFLSLTLMGLTHFIKNPYKKKELDEMTELLLKLDGVLIIVALIARIFGFI